MVKLQIGFQRDNLRDAWPYAIVAILVFLFFAPSEFDFFPSSRWETIVSLFALMLAAITLVLCSLYLPRKRSEKWGVLNTLLIIFMVVLSVWYSCLYMVAFGLGDIATRFVGTTKELDITGTKKEEHHHSQWVEYYIDTAEIPQNINAKLHISGKEYDRLQNPVKMHLYCKESYFGLLVDHYSFTHQPALTTPH